MGHPLILAALALTLADIVVAGLAWPLLLVLASVWLGLALLAIFPRPRLRPALWLLLLFAIGVMYVDLRVTGALPLAQRHGPQIASLNKLKQRCVQVIHAHVPAPYDALLGGLLLGVSASPLPEEWNELYRRTGVTHLLVVSGSQIALLVGVCSACARALRLPPLASFALTSVVNVAFVLMTGADPSVTRAGIMAEIMLLGLWLGRSSYAPLTFALAWLLMLLYEPRYLFMPGFQLSFAATAALLWIAPAFEKKIALAFGPPEKRNAWQNGLSGLLALAMAPSLVTLPLVMQNFSSLSLASFVSNLLVTPWVELVVLGGFAGTFIGLIFGPLAHIVFQGLWGLMWCMQHMLQFIGQLPYAYLHVKAPGWFFVGVCMAAVMLLAQRWHHDRRLSARDGLWLFTLLMLSLGAALVPRPGAGSAPVLAQVSFLDVGQGDAAVLLFPRGRVALIDGGGQVEYGSAPAKNFKSPGKKVLLPYLRRQGVNKVDVMLLSHAHADHLEGLLDVLKVLPVGLVLDPGLPYDTALYREFLETLRVKKVPYKHARRGQHMALSPDCDLRILHPDQPFLSGTASDINNNSAVARLDCAETQVLFTGDIEADAEQLLLTLPELSEVTVLKVPHHGSHSSSSAAFLERIHPQLAVISCGRHNHFGHPHRDVLERLRQQGCAIYRTDENGNIELYVHNQNVSVRLQPSWKRLPYVLQAMIKSTTFRPR